MTLHQKRGEVKRAYHSPRREAQAEATRVAIVEAARALFVEFGYAGTTIRDIASAAEVAEPTVYATLGDKASIAKAIADDVQATGSGTSLGRVLGDLRAESKREERVRAAVRAISAAYAEGLGDIRDAITVGAASDPRLVELAAGFERSSRETNKLVVDLIVGPEEMADGQRDRAADEIWALASGHVYRRLVRQCGWTPERYEEWLVAVIEQSIARP